jgi:hypothetical protein
MRSRPADAVHPVNGLPEQLRTLGAMTLVGVLQTDQQHRWARGERPTVEDYLQQHPHLRDNVASRPLTAGGEGFTAWGVTPAGREPAT